jgi:nucleoside-diphosphate-sugar epimerase
MLAAHGHQVVGMARHTSAEVGSNPNVELVTADALDASAVASAVRRAAPDAIVNLLTAIPADLNPRRMIKEFQLTNRALRN